MVDRHTYLERMLLLLADSDKFRKITVDPFLYIIHLEDKINNFLRGLGNELYKKLHISGSVPGVLYGLPKTHKTGLPFRPILSAIGSPTYTLSKFMVPLIDEVTRNEYTLKDSFEFAEFVSNTKGTNLHLTSFDVASLFTNVPVTETCEIITRGLFPTPGITVGGLNKDEFSALLGLAVGNSIFLFNGNLYQQVDGVAMGSPLGPSFANAFLSYHERLWLEHCPEDFRPVLFKRYVDDCFVAFESKEQSQKFLQYLNSKHPNIKFSMEEEHNNQLPFLDVLIQRQGDSLSTSIYRKPSSTLLGTNFFSFVPENFRLSGLRSRIYRALKISSNWVFFHNEMVFLREFSEFNLFPNKTFFSIVQSVLSDYFCPKQLIPDVPKLKSYIKIPYIGPNTSKLQNLIHKSLRHCFPAVQFIFIPINNCSISSFFRFKDRIPDFLRSSVVYKYTCADCKTRYIGQTGLQLKLRICKHLGVSHRTGRSITSPETSAIRKHASDAGHSIEVDSFEIISSSPFPHQRLVLESLHIRNLKPELNQDQTSVKLFIL